jgi:hypothetical protein
VLERDRIGRADDDVAVDDPSERLQCRTEPVRRPGGEDGDPARPDLMLIRSSTHRHEITAFSMRITRSPVTPSANVAG